MSSKDAGHRRQWTQWLAALAASSAMFNANSVDIVWFTVRRVEEISVMMVGMVAIIIGAILGAVFADTIGRKNTLLIMLIFAIPRAAYYLIDEIELSLVYALFLKIGSGLTCTLVPLYISEIAGTNNCGKLMVMQLAVVQSGMFSLFSPVIFRASDPRLEMNENLQMAFLAVSMSFHAMILGIFPETPQYLNWIKMYREAGLSLSFFRRIEHVKVRKNATNPTVASWKEKIGEIFRLENRRSLGIIFSLIIIKWASEMRRNDLILMRMTLRHGWSSRVDFLLLTFFLSSLIFSLFIMLTIGVFERKLSLLFVILVSLAASIIGMTSLMDNIWVQFGIGSIQYMGHLIFIGVTLAYVGKFFTVNVRAIAIALVIIFEVLSRDIIRSIEASFFDEDQNAHFTRAQFAFVSGTHIVAFFLILILFPKTHKTPSSEIEIETSTGIEYL